MDIGEELHQAQEVVELQRVVIIVCLRVLACRARAIRFLWERNLVSDSQFDQWLVPTLNCVDDFEMFSDIMNIFRTFFLTNVSGCLDVHGHGVGLLKILLAVPFICICQVSLFTVLKYPLLCPKSKFARLYSSKIPN